MVAVGPVPGDEDQVFLDTGEQRLPYELVADGIRTHAFRGVAEELAAVSPCDEFVGPAKDPHGGVAGEGVERPGNRIGGEACDHALDIAAESADSPVISLSGALQRSSIRVAADDGGQADLACLLSPHVVRDPVENARPVAEELIDDDVGNDQVFGQRTDIRNNLFRILAGLVEFEEEIRIDTYGCHTIAG
ncbi:hypothetical protein DSECCO2_530560 [anaerobic digester metagenome]